MAKARSTDDTPENGARPWTPPRGAQPIELAEFYKFANKGEVVIGRIQRITSRQDPLDDKKVMRGLVLSPAIAVATNGTRSAFRNLAIGLSAHLSVLIGQPDKEVGSAFAFQYDGTRPSAQRGKAPSHQFNVFKLTEKQFVVEVRTTDPDHAELLLSGAATDAGEDSDLPF
jgi:hypothetical protein